MVCIGAAGAVLIVAYYSGGMGAGVIITLSGLLRNGIRIKKV